MNPQRVFLTGATGILGSWLLADALRQGYQATVLMRDNSEADARRRLDKVLGVAGLRHAAQGVQICGGDVSQPDFGLSRGTLAKLRRDTDLFIHCAASVSFDPQKEQDTWQTNMQGAVHVLDVLADTQIPLYHVSTAYVAGKNPGLWRETDLHAEQEFNNSYEHSQYECETLVQGAFASGNYRGAIFRPAIIVGATLGGRIAQFLNFYGFLRLMEVALDPRLHPGGPVRLPLNPSCTKNLVPVDWTAAALWKIIQKEGPSGKVYNLTHPRPVSLGDLVHWANSRMDGTDVTFESVESIDDKGTLLERMAQMQLRHYNPYLKQEPAFDRTNTDQALNGALPFPTMDSSFFDMLFHFASSQGWRNVFAQQRKTREIAAPVLGPIAATAAS
ncbi:MAG: SDR family oxidoreductase [Candidatus Hydrogenedentes bacterium]|nr:SDR family oxidoreductase [Candidatus Hydrogenedentota bacterium]